MPGAQSISDRLVLASEKVSDLRPRIAVYFARILRGTPAGETPIEEPTAFLVKSGSCDPGSKAIKLLQERARADHPVPKHTGRPPKDHRMVLNALLPVG